MINQEFSDLIKRLLEGGDTDKRNKIDTRWMGVSEDTTKWFLHLYTMKKTGTDYQKWKRTTMEGMCTKHHNKINFKFYMIVKLRKSWNRNRRPFLLQSNNLIINRNHLNRRYTISIYLSKMSHMIWYGFVFATLRKQQGTWKAAITSSFSKILLQQKINRVARKLQIICLDKCHKLLPHISALSLPDLLIDISYLHHHKSTHPYHVFYCFALFLFLLIVPMHKILVILGGGGD